MTPLLGCGDPSAGSEGSGDVGPSDLGADGGSDEGALGDSGADALTDPLIVDAGGDPDVPYFEGEGFVLPDSHVNVIRRVSAPPSVIIQ